MYRYYIIRYLLFVSMFVYELVTSLCVREVCSAMGYMHHCTGDPVASTQQLCGRGHTEDR